MISERLPYYAAIALMAGACGDDPQQAPLVSVGPTGSSTTGAGPTTTGASPGTTGAVGAVTTGGTPHAASAMAASSTTGTAVTSSSSSATTGGFGATSAATTTDGTSTTGNIASTTGSEASTSGMDMSANTSGTATGAGGATSINTTATTGGETTGGNTSGMSAGCGQNAERPNPQQQQTMSVDGTTRYYLTYLPTNYDPNTPLPLIFAFHGLNMNNYWAAHDSSGFRLIEESGNQAILVYPQGSGDVPQESSQWGNIASRWTAGGNDFAFFEALLEFVEDSYCVDTSRIFSVGFSMGGMFTNGLACSYGDVLRGIAPVAGWGPGGFQPSCNSPAGPVAVLSTQGTTDDVVTPDLGIASRDYWLNQNGCSNSSTPGPSGCVTYDGCNAGYPVGYCEHGGNHFVPGETGARVWEFFSSLN